MTAVLQTARLRLRPVRADDAAALSDLVTPMISQWTANWRYPFTPAMAEERIATTMADNAAGTAFNRVLVDRIDDQFIGWFRVTLTSPDPRTGSLGYWLNDAFHGRGYLTEALPVFVTAAIATLRLDLLEAGAQPQNTASIAALTRIGMRFSGQRLHHVPARDRSEPTNFYLFDCGPTAS